MVQGLTLPPFCDSHVHLGLIDRSLLAAGGIGRVLDLGWDPRIAQGWLASADVEVQIAGPLLAAPGGYPLASGWAPDAAVRQIPDAATAAVAIADVEKLGATVVKITLNSEAGPVFDDELLEAVVALARARRLPVVAHAQGRGQAERALNAGVDCLAHAPWSETLSDDIINRMAARMSWISTLDIHGWGQYGADFTRAMDNLTRFAARGGAVHYGTDLGNGPLPVGLNRRELVALADAGLGASALLESLRGLVPPSRQSPLASVIAGAEAVGDLQGVDDLMVAVVVTLSHGEDAL